MNANPTRSQESQQGVKEEKIDGIDEVISHKRYRRKRTAFTQEQLTRMEEAFEFNKYPGIELREDLSRELDVNEGRIQVWFQNRRSKWRRRQNISKPRVNNRISVKTEDSFSSNQLWPCPSIYGQVSAYRQTHWSVPSDVTMSRDETACTSSTDIQGSTKVTHEKNSQRLVTCVSSIMSTSEGTSFCNDRNNVHDQHYDVPHFGVRRSLDEILAAKGLSVLENLYYVK